MMRRRKMRFIKDPDATLDFNIDWSDWLNGDYIMIVTWTVPTGLTKISQSRTDTVATVWLSGGTLGVEYDVGCMITTSEGRRDERTISIKVTNR
jgi:hypothetical protein